MIEKRFYQLTKTSLEKAVTTLSQTITNSNQTTLILAKNDEQAKMLDDALWVHSSFLPHARNEPDGVSKIMISTHIEHDCDVALIMDDLNPDASRAKMVCYMFHSVNADHVSTRRGHWKSWSDEGEHLTYWAENEAGRWEKKAEINAPKTE